MSERGKHSQPRQSDSVKPSCCKGPSRSFTMMLAVQDCYGVLHNLKATYNLCKQLSVPWPPRSLNLEHPSYFTKTKEFHIPTMSRLHVRPATMATAYHEATRRRDSIPIAYANEERCNTRATALREVRPLLHSLFIPIKSKTDPCGEPCQNMGTHHPVWPSTIRPPVHPSAISGNSRHHINKIMGYIIR